MTERDGQATFDEILNFRDVGKHINYLTGRSILKPGLLFRSARPDAASTQDRLSLVTEHQIRTIIDLRTPTEHLEQSRAEPGNIPSSPAATATPSQSQKPRRVSEITYKDINLNGPNYSTSLIKQLSYLHVAKLVSFYALGYRTQAISVLGKNVMAARGLAGLAQDSLTHCKAEIKQVFDVFSEPTSWPVLVHCTQGKDRTGLIVLLVLLLCGVSEEAIDGDYVRSERELVPERREKLAEVRSIGLPDEFADCPSGWTRSVCGFLEGQYGGARAYLMTCGVLDEQQQVLKDLLQIAG